MYSLKVHIRLLFIQQVLKAISWRSSSIPPLTQHSRHHPLYLALRESERAGFLPCGGLLSVFWYGRILYYSSVETWTPPFVLTVLKGRGNVLAMATQ